MIDAGLKDLHNHERDGGPVYPGKRTEVARTVNGQTEWMDVTFSGMTLRDYFAATVLPTLVGLDIEESLTRDDLAVAAYVYADAMLQARQR